MAVARRVVRMRNAEPLVSFTFDDFPRSALVRGGTILEANGARGTFFASLGLMGGVGPLGEMFSRDDLGELVEHSHELGCHTFDHFHAWDTAATEFEASILRNREALQKYLPGTSFKTFSYPISCPQPATKRRIAKYFDCCRGGGHTFNVGSIDLNFVKSCFLERVAGDFGLVSACINANSRARGWLILTTHDISENPSRFGCTPGFFERAVEQAKRSGASIVTISEGLTRIRNTNTDHTAALQDISKRDRFHVSPRFNA